MKSILTALKKLVRKQLLGPYETHFQIGTEAPVPSSVSDFFFYRNDEFGTIHVLENPAFVQNGGRATVHIQAIFHDRQGKVCHREDLRFDTRDYCLDTKKFADKLDIYGGFWFALKESSVKVSFIPQFRGYTGYAWLKADPNFHSYVHGNFGGLYDNQGVPSTLAKRSSKKFYYTPQIELGLGQEYFLLNPYAEQLKTELWATNAQGSKKLQELELAPFATGLFKLPADASMQGKCPTFVAHSPVNRPVAFEFYPNMTFDALHT